MLYKNQTAPDALSAGRRETEKRQRGTPFGSERSSDPKPAYRRFDFFIVSYSTTALQDKM